MKAARLGLLPLLALTVSGCGLSISFAAPSPTIPSVGVNVVNHISNLVVTGDIFSHAVGTTSEATPQLVAPCGGTVAVRAFQGNVGPGALALFKGLDDTLDRAYGAGATIDTGDLARYNVGIMWSDGTLVDGDWIVVTPEEVMVSKTEPAALVPGATCEQWAYEGD
jgi:hypothetical protein